MPDPAFQRPDALVLAVGGVVGEAWMTGMLAGIEDAAGVDFRDCEYLVGSSAGSIVAANLAAGRSPRRPAEADMAADGAATPREAPREPGAPEALARAAVRWSVALTGPLVIRAAPLEAPARAISRRAMLAALPRGDERLDELEREIGRLGVRFDGRLRIPAVDRATGRRVIFGAPGAPRATVAEAVTASCSIPGRFRPFVIGGHEYVDGGAWSPSNIDAAPVGANARVLCLNSASALTGGILSRGGPVVALVRATAGVEALAMRRKGAEVDVLGPDQRAAEAMGIELMNPTHRAAALAAGYGQGLTVGEGRGARAGDAA